jgi:hypothetical protein
MGCQATASGFDWSVVMAELTCVKPCHLVIGGLNGTRDRCFFKYFRRKIQRKNWLF